MTEAVPSRDSDSPVDLGQQIFFGAKSIDALRMLLQKSCEKRYINLRANGLVLIACLLLSPASLRASTGDGVSAISGVIKDAQGVAQMGILVQLIAPGFGTVASTFTDEHGRYTLTKLAVGHYRLRASSVLFAPATLPLVDVNQGASSVVNLTMAALFGTASWLPIHRRAVNESADDWAWTLRSSANRPILRLQDEGAPSLRDQANEPEVGWRESTRVHVEVSGGSSGLGHEGIRQAVTVVHEASGSPLRTIYVESGDHSNAPMRAVVSEEKRAALGGGTRNVVTYLSDPELVFSTQKDGLQALRFTSAQQGSLGEIVTFEVGGTLEGIHAGSTTLIQAHPFLRLTASPGGSWRLQYHLATEREVAEYADVQVDSDHSRSGDPEREAWVLDVAGRGPRTEAGRHQEVSAAHPVGQGKVEVAYYHDTLEALLLYGSRSSTDSSVVEGLITSARTGTFATIVKGKTTDGARISYVSPVWDGLWVVAEYAIGNSEAFTGGAVGDVEHGLREVKAHNSHTAFVAVQGTLHDSGTQVRASYRWQPSGDVSAVDPYSAMSDKAYLGMFARQQLHAGSWLPTRLEATLDLSNLLAQGYRPFVSVDGRTLYLAQTPRSIQIGLAFNF